MLLTWSASSGLNPTLSLDFLTPVLDGRITASGGANGTRVNSSGLIVAATTPRFDYDPVTLACKGLLVEEARTNLLLKSSTLTTSPWTTVMASVVANGTGPDGGTAFKEVPNSGVSTTGANGNGGLYQSATVAASSSFVLTIYAKAAEVSFLRLREGATTGARVKVNLTTGNVLYEVGTSAEIDVTAINVGNGWWRVNARRTTIVAETSELISIKAGIDTGDGVSGVLLACPQLEQGSFSTSYIPTGASTVTRTADSLTMTGTNFSSWFNAAAFSGLAQFTVGSGVGTQPIISYDDNSSNNQVRLYVSGTSLKFTVTTGGSTVADLTLGSVTAGSTYKAAFACAANDFAAVMTGGSVQTDTSGALPTVDRARIGSDQAGNYFDGWQQSFKAYPRRLTNAQLQVLT